MSVDDPRGATMAPRGVFGPGGTAGPGGPRTTAVLVLAAAALLVLAAVAACGRRRRAPARADADVVAADAAAFAAPGGDANADAALVDGAGAREIPAGWTDVAALVPDAVLDLRYATADNITGAPLYPEARCLLRPAVARRLADAARRLAERGHRLVLWDCYRPASVHAELWRRVPDRRFVAEPRFAADGRPVAGSGHSRGAAVDVSLTAADGTPRAMPTDHDDFGPRAGGARATGDVARHLDDLRAAMTGAGFVPLATEWWHFAAPDALSYRLSDDPLSR